jgi:hypothetical protein
MTKDYCGKTLDNIYGKELHHLQTLDKFLILMTFHMFSTKVPGVWFLLGGSNVENTNKISRYKLTKSV